MSIHNSAFYYSHMLSVPNVFSLTSLLFMVVGSKSTGYTIWVQDVSNGPIGSLMNWPKSNEPHVCSSPPNAQVGGVIGELTKTPWVA